MSLAAKTALDESGIAWPAVEIDSPFLLVDPRRDAAELVMPAVHASAAAVAAMVRYGSGFVCVALPEDVADSLGLPAMVRGGRRMLGGVPTVTVDAAAGVGTGISATDRAHTLRLLADPATRPDDLTRPGHVVPIRVSGHRRAARRSPVHAAIAAMRRFGLPPVAAMTGVVSESDPRRMASHVEACALADRLGLPVVVA